MDENVKATDIASEALDTPETAENKKVPQDGAKKTTAKEEISKVIDTIDKPAETVVKKIPRFIYLGPNLFKYGLMTNKVYKGEIKIDETLLKKCPLIKNLVVPVEKIDTVLQAIKIKGTVQNQAVQQIMKGSAD